MNVRLNPYLLALPCSLLLLSACQRDAETDVAEQPPAEQAAEIAPVEATVDHTEILAEDLRAHVAVLASDEFGGRAPMSEGEDLTLDYLEKQFREYGLEPMFGDSYRQPVPLVSITASPDADLTVSGADGETTFDYGQEVVLGTLRVVEESSISDSEIVWVGHGVVAPEFGWNDYEGLDVTGKTVLMLINDPGFRTQDPEMFNGNAMTYYGRWTYKYEEAARQGAAAAIIIHDTAPAAYPWDVVKNSWSGAQFHLATENDNMDRVPIEGWVQKHVAEKILAMAGHDLATLEQAASTAAVTPLPLGISASATLHNTYERSQSYNIGAVLPGREAPDEAFLYMAHWDHLGIVRQEGEEEGADQIYNGALDNASGIAGLLELAQYWSARAEAPRRSVGFLAVTAEESGLLGSQAYAASPAIPLNKTAGAINMDGINIWGPTKDIIVVGHGSSELENILVEAATEQNRDVVPESNPERGTFFRSDHFSLAKQGLPVLYSKNGMLHLENSADYIARMQDEWIEEHYHKPSDELTDQWDLRGAVQDLKLYYWVGEAVADGDGWPNWFQGNAFRAKRDAMMSGEALPLEGN